MSDSKSDAILHEAFLRLYVEHQRSVYGYIYTLVPKHADAEDLLSETSLTLWAKFGEYEQGTNFVAWACKIAHFKVLNHRKSKSKNQPQLSDQLIATLADTRLAREPAISHRREGLRHCIERLSEKDSRLIQACYAGADSIKHVAKQLGRPVNSVYTSLNRIRRSLMECVERRLRLKESEL